MLELKLLLSFNLFLFSSIVTANDDYVYYPNLNIQYKFYKSPKNWLDAKITCAKDNATLALPANEEEASTLYGFLKNLQTEDKGINVLNNNMFLNFHDLYEEGEFVTDKGTPLPYLFHKFSNGQPDNYQNSEHCGSLYGDGKLNDYPCNDKLRFVCQKQNVSYESALFSKFCQNDDPEYKLESFSGKYFKFHIYPRTWNQARSMCHAENGRLAVVESKQEEDFLVNMFNNPQNKINRANYDYIFVGIHDLYREGQFYTVSGEAVSNGKYIRWLSGKPDNFRGGEHCGSMTSSGALDDVPCSLKKPFFCEKENVFPINPRIEDTIAK